MADDAPKGTASPTHEPISGPVPMKHRLRLGQIKDGENNVQGVGNPSDVPTMSAGGRKTW